MKAKEIIKENTLNKKETAEMEKIHKEFEKTIFGKRIKAFYTAWVVIVVIFFCMSCICFGIGVINDAMNEALYYTHYMTVTAIFFTSAIICSGICLLIRTHYEHMAMMFAYQNKLLKK